MKKYITITAALVFLASCNPDISFNPELSNPTIGNNTNANVIVDARPVYYTSSSEYVYSTVVRMNILSASVVTNEHKLTFGINFSNNSFVYDYNSLSWLMKVYDKDYSLTNAIFICSSVLYIEGINNIVTSFNYFDIITNSAAGVSISKDMLFFQTNMSAGKTYYIDLFVSKASKLTHYGGAVLKIE
jgi:hypothetical protein